MTAKRNPFKNIIKHTIRGCGYLPHCGHHSGTPILIMFILIGAIVGSNGGWKGALGGAGVMTAIFGPMYLYGAYETSVFDEELTAREKIQ
jgi:hypothetical protein